MDTKKIPIKLYEEAWNEVGEPTPLFDLSKTDFGVFDDGDVHFEGMHKTVNGDRHGIARETVANGQIVQASFKDDRQHGLSLRWKNGSLFVSLH